MVQISTLGLQCLSSKVKGIMGETWLMYFFFTVSDQRMLIAAFMSFLHNDYAGVTQSCVRVKNVGYLDRIIDFCRTMVYPSYKRVSETERNVTSEFRCKY